MKLKSNYWKCQLIGWSLASLYWTFRGYLAGHFNIAKGLAEYVTDVFVYILITHLYRNFALRHHWPRLNLRELLKRIIPAAVVLSLAYSVVALVKLYLYHRWLSPAFPESFLSFVSVNWLDVSVTGIRLISIWLLAYHMYHYARREINLARENARLAIVSRDAQLNNLSAQLNPHFLFNSLNNIKALVIENPKSARRAIDLLSDLLRTALYGRDVLVVALRDELSLVRDYLELEQMRLEERLRFCIRTDEALDNAPILRLSIQTLVENAVKHGIDKQKEGGLIAINVEREDGFIKIEVRNPGRLDKLRTADGVGLKNLRERLQLKFKGKAKFDITGGEEGIVLSTLFIPNA